MIRRNMRCRGSGSCVYGRSSRTGFCGGDSEMGFEVDFCDSICGSFLRVEFR